MDSVTRSANAIAFVVSDLVTYLIDIYWVFVLGRYSGMVEINLFYLVSGLSALIGTMLMSFLIRQFGMLTMYTFDSNGFAAILINYVMRKIVIFGG